MLHIVDNSPGTRPLDKALIHSSVLYHTPSSFSYSDTCHGLRPGVYHCSLTEGIKHWALPVETLRLLLDYDVCLCHREATAFLSRQVIQGFTCHGPSQLICCSAQSSTSNSCQQRQVHWFGAVQFPLFWLVSRITRNDNGNHHTKRLGNTRT